MQTLLNTKNCPEKKDSFDRVLGSFESPPGMNLRIDAGPINLAYGIPVIHKGCCITGDAKTLRFGLYICDSHAPLWVLTSHVFCITYRVMEWSSNSNEMCVGWWSSVIVGIPTHLRVLDYQIQLTSNSPQQQWTDRQRHEVTTSSVSLYLNPSRCWNNVNCRVTRKPTAMLKPSAITAKAKTACEALYSCSRGIMEVEHGYIWKVSMIGDAPILHFSCLWEEG